MNSDAVDAPVVMTARTVCRLAVGQGAAAAGVRGIDGAPSVVVDGLGYWFFGDTLRDAGAGRTDVIPATVATTQDTNGSDCVDLNFKASGGLATPLFPRGAETTAWPDGILLLDDGSVAFYVVKVQRESPFAWHVSSIGLGVIAAGTTDGVRQVESLWDERSGFPSRVSGASSPVRIGSDVILYLHTDDGSNYVAKAPIDGIRDARAYTYWTGGGWSARPQSAQSMWTVDTGGLPADNGVAVSFDAASGRWLAVYNGSLATVDVRSAPQPWGPWSEPTKWLDCRPLVSDRYPYCYSAQLHRELSRDGSILYVTFSSQEPYDVSLVELHMATPMHEWRDANGDLRYAATSPGAGYTDERVAFYGSTIALDGLAPVYLDDAGTYTFDQSPGAAVPAFYSYRTAPPGPVSTVPVYRWRREGREALGAGKRDGWERGDVAFYAPCHEVAGCSQ